MDLLVCGAYILEYREAVEYGVVIVLEIVLHPLADGAIQTGVVVEECCVEHDAGLLNLGVHDRVLGRPHSFEATSQLEGGLSRLLIEVSD